MKWNELYQELVLYVVPHGPRMLFNIVVVVVVEVIISKSNNREIILLYKTKAQHNAIEDNVLEAKKKNKSVAVIFVSRIRNRFELKMVQWINKEIKISNKNPDGIYVHWYFSAFSTVIVFVYNGNDVINDHQEFPSLAHICTNKQTHIWKATATTSCSHLTVWFWSVFNCVCVCRVLGFWIVSIEACGMRCGAAHGKTITRLQMFKHLVISY